MADFSFIILTFNEEQHLPRLLNSLKELNAPTFILDSGSTDETLTIAKNHKATIKINPFENHPKQWHEALNTFAIKTPWIIGLDADQVITPTLFDLLKNFKNEDFLNINGIYFNRKNYFQSKWIKHGGYFPFYMLKMFRTNIGYSDLNENMDHRFIVSGSTLIWKNGFLLEENLKENNIDFWIKKHERYSDLIADEEIERSKKLRIQSIKPSLLGNPDQKRAWLKKLWWQLPLGLRPYLYFSYRFIFQLGFLDGKKGLKFHYLHALWFRKLVDQKISHKKAFLMQETTINQKKKADKIIILFIIKLLVIYILFSQGNLFMNSVLSANGRFHQSFLADNLNYIQWLRSAIIIPATWLINAFGYGATHNQSDVLLNFGPSLRINYSCIGLGVMSFFAAFVISFPSKFKSKFKLFFLGVLLIYSLNIIRIAALGILTIAFNTQQSSFNYQHEIFNVFVYLSIFILLYFWIKKHTNIELPNS